MDFLNGLFLAGAATALVPVIIHLVQRRRVKQVVFGSLRLLRRTPHRVVHRRRFEELLLVLLRAAALALLAVAFARPFLDAPHERRPVGGETFIGEQADLVLIDNSYSMRAEGRLDRAKEEALKSLREADPAAKVGLAAYSSQFDELCAIGAERPAAEQAVRAVRQSWRGTNLALALRQANRALTRAGRNEARRRIVLIGDFQDSSWTNRGDWTLAPGVELEIRNVARKPVPNVLISRVVVPRLAVAGGFTEVISASIRNLTDHPLTDAPVVFRVDGRQAATLSVNIRPGAEAPVRFRHKFTEPGDVSGSIAVQAADEMPDDNVARFCLHVTPRVGVLLVNADRAEKMVLNDGLFLQTALAPATEGLVSPFEVRQIGPEGMKPADLDGVDVVLFLNTSRLPAAMTEVPPDKRAAPDGRLHSPLGRFVARGGGIGLICGSKVAPAEFNRTFEGLAPCGLLRPAMEAGDGPVVINQTDPRHEIFAEFAEPHSGDISLAEFKQYFLVTDALAAQVPARFSHKDAHPALLERLFAQAGSAGGPQVKGKSILFVSSMDLEWNDLCLKSVFVPFVHQLTKRLCARRTGSVRNFVVGDDITHFLPAGAGEVQLRRMAEPPAQARGPADKIEWDKPVVLKPSPAGGGEAVSFSPDRPGVYELAYTGGSARFAVNLDGGEADLRPLDTQLLVTSVRKGPVLEGAAAGGEGSVVAKSTARERVESAQRLWRYLMLAVLTVLAVEMLLARRIGRA